MGSSSPREFDSSLRRIFLLIQQMGEEVVEAINTNNHEALRHTHDVDINVDKFHDYCLRVLNKTGFKEIKNAHLTFTTLYLLELLGDEFKNISRHIVEDMVGQKLTNLNPLAEKVLNQFNRFYKLFYKFDKNEALEISNHDLSIYFYLPRLYKLDNKSKSKLSDIELEIFNHFRRVTRFINALTELRIEMEF